MVTEALGRLSWGPFLLAASHEGRKAAIVARSACACGGEPPLVCVAVKKGHWIGPVIRDARRFALSLLGPRDRVALRKFAEGARSRDTESLEWLATEDLAHAGPVLQGASLALACDVVRRIDLDADCELYVGLITAARCAPERVDDAAPREAAPREAGASEPGASDRVAPSPKASEPPSSMGLATEYHQPIV
jgi:flavin reductase (DIM6/NTAB) family NADH-FMN oxidoreductase RutF